MMIYDRWIKYDIYVNIYIYMVMMKMMVMMMMTMVIMIMILIMMMMMNWPGATTASELVMLPTTNRFENILSDFIECKKIGVAETHSFKTWK